jgi:hypothetical protein
MRTEKARDGGCLSDGQSQAGKHRKKETRPPLVHVETGALTDESSPHPALATPFIATFLCLQRTRGARMRRDRYVRENASGEGDKRSAKASQIETLDNQFVVTACKEERTAGTLASN